MLSKTIHPSHSKKSRTVRSPKASPKQAKRSDKLLAIDLTKLQIDPEIISVIPERVARANNTVAFREEGNTLDVARLDSVQTDLIEMLSRKTGLAVRSYQVTQKDIDYALTYYKRDLQTVIDRMLAEIAEPGELPVTRIVTTLIQSAYEAKASDLHLEPQVGFTLIRFRIDGVLQKELTLGKALSDRIVNRIKVLANLRTDEHLSAQDGKMQLYLKDETLDVRVSVVPIADGEKVVLRLLSGHSRQYSLEDLGMKASDLAKITKAYHRPFGMILSTGPTGSGKTTSIYAMLKTLNQPDRNITTIEDPVEYRIQGANQIQMNSRTNLTFANGLRSILRQDPNIIFVGEIRDNETAGIATNAALTGHLVFSTLHTGDSATTIPRLIDMRVEPFLIASTIRVIIAQRLVRKICESCKTPISISQRELSRNFARASLQRAFPDLESHKSVKVFKSNGCHICHQTGFVGRLGLFEVLEVTKPIRELITTHASADAIKQAAIAEGMSTMLDDGLEKVAKGLTTLEEILRVTEN